MRRWRTSRGARPPDHSSVRDHTSLEAWKEARAVALGCLAISRAHWRPDAAAMFYQLQRATLSVQLNIAEGYALGSRALFARHIRIAYGSAVEAGEILQLQVDAAIVPATLGEDLLAHNRRCARLLLGLLRKLTPA